MKTFRLNAATLAILALAIASSALAQNPQSAPAPQDALFKTIPVTDTLPAPPDTSEPSAQATTVASGSFTVETPNGEVIASHDAHKGNTTLYARTLRLPRTRLKSVATQTTQANALPPAITKPQADSFASLPRQMTTRETFAAHPKPPIAGGRRQPFVVYLYRAMHPSDRRFFCPPQFPLAVLYI